MRYAFPPDVQQQVAAWMARGEYSTEDDVLRDALRALAAAEEDLASVREAVAEFRSGDPGVLLDEAFEAIRRCPPGTAMT